MLGNFSTKSLNDMATLVELMKNADEYADKIAELKQKADDLESERLKLTKAKKLDSLISDYKEKISSANDMIEEAKVSAQDTMSEAKQKAEKMIIQAETDVKNIYQEAKSVAAETQARRSESEKIDKEAKLLMVEAQNLMQNAINMNIESKKIRKDLEAKKEAIEKALNGVS